MIIHVDIDNTIVDIFRHFEIGHGIASKKSTYDLNERYYPGAEDDMKRWLDEGRDEAVNDRAFETIDALIAAGHVVWIATSRTPLAMKRFQEKYPKYASIVRSKRDIINSGERCDVLVDDHPLKEHVDLAKKTFIVQRDYNTTYMPAIPRVASIADAFPVL
jgi:hypothetical protein